MSSFNSNRWSPSHSGYRILPYRCRCKTTDRAKDREKERERERESSTAEVSTSIHKFYPAEDKKDGSTSSGRGSTEIESAGGRESKGKKEMRSSMDY
jgi:hypothetical protein